MMAQEFRYPLTRICLRNGTLTLPLAMRSVFPDDGDITVQDTVRGVEFTVRVDGRQVSGLDGFLAEHDLEVNDEVVVKRLDDGGLGLTAAKRARKPDYRRPEVLARMLDDIIEARVPLTEGEIRALHPDLPEDFPLREALEREERLAMHQGRWHSRQVLEEERRAAERLAAERQRVEVERRVEAERRAEAAARAAEQRDAERRAEAAERAAVERLAAQREAERLAAERETQLREVQREAERLLAERAAAERAAMERAASERASEQRAAEERAAQQRAAQESAVERAARERDAAQQTSEVEPAAEPAIGEAQATEDRDVVAAWAEDDASGAQADAQELGRANRGALAARAEEDARALARRQREARADEQASERASDEGADELERFDWDEPVGRGFRLPWKRGKAKPAKPTPAVERAASKDPFRLDRLGEARPSVTRPTVVPAPRAGLFPGDTALNSATLPPGDPVKTKRAREIFGSLGYRVEGLAHGQLMLHADLGRRNHRVLLHVLPDNERLDWAALLARRRESNATYLAVLGDHRDLHRLTAPADLARATLWSWAGVERVVELSHTVMLGPVDLEQHFERDGVYEYGLERFERCVAKRVQEKGVLSAVLTRLAGMRAPSVFVVDDLVGDTDAPRDQIVRVLERLSEAPFQLVTKVDNGEFCLRHRVHDALDQLSEYAVSLRARLPDRHRERVRGLADDDLAAAFEPIGADEISEVTAEPTPRAVPDASAHVAPRAALPRPDATPKVKDEQRRAADADATEAAPAEPQRGPGRVDAIAPPAPKHEARPAPRATPPAPKHEARPAPARRAAPRELPVEREGPRREPAAESRPGTRPGSQDVLFGEGFVAEFGVDPVDEVDVAEMVEPKPRKRQRR